MSPETRLRICEEIAYHLSAEYGITVTVISKEDLRDFRVYAPPREVPREHVLGYYEGDDGRPIDAESNEYAWLTVKERSRLARSLGYAMEKEDGVVTAAELRGLHCKEWKDCIHGVSGYATFIDNTVNRYRIFERVRRGRYKITDRGRELITAGRLEVKKRKPLPYRSARFVPIKSAEGESCR